MYSTQKLLEMLISEKSSTRYDACEWLRISPESSPEIIYALRKALNDPQPEVAYRAAYALQADIHHRQSVKMGLEMTDGRDLPAVAQPIATVSGVPPMSMVQADYLALLKGLRSWGVWSLVWGGLSLVASGIFSSPWGILLIIVGLASFYFRSASMYIIYGVTLAWATLQNLGGLQITWIVFSAIQIYATVQVFLRYRRYHTAELQLQNAPSMQTTEVALANRSARFFPWIGALLGLGSLFSVIFIFVLGVVIGIARGGVESIPTFLYYLIELSINLGVLGFALGLASILSKYRPKVMGFLALIAGTLTLLIDLGFMVLNLTG